jgi:5-methylcytosine-specific restriction endonuclease McrA
VKSLDSIKHPIILGYLQQSGDQAVEVTRAILVFGKNSATYKFALLKTLMESPAVDQLKHEEIGEPFLKHLVEHHRNCPHQHNRGETKLTKAIDDYIHENTTWNELFKVAEASIYNNVFDAFQNIGGGTIEKDHLLFEHDKKGKRIVLTDNLNGVLDNEGARQLLSQEAEARWRVVEEAWRGNLSPLLSYDDRDRSFYTKVGDHRVNLRSAVDTLRPYQHGRCFYCNCTLREDVGKEHDTFADVDHVIPLSLLVRQPLKPGVNPNGVWNLVLACKKCNRGEQGKFDTVPHKSFFERLLARNLYMTEEHKHSMKYSVLASLGVTYQNQVKQQLQQIYQPFHFFPKWSPKELFAGERQ